jgi:hypothetical protein
VGFLCSDGVVLCSDRQLTGEGGYKFEECKIFSSQWGDNYSMVFSYAGDPDAARVMFGKTRDGLWEGIAKSRGAFTNRKAMAILEKVFKGKHTKGLQVLIGLVGTEEKKLLVKTNEQKVFEGRAEFIGYGDGSVLRYLYHILDLPVTVTMNEAHIVGSYVVSVANQYVDKCGGGPDHALLRENGGMTWGSGGPWPNQRERFLYCEEEIGRGLRGLLYSAGTNAIEIVATRKKN